MVPLDRIELERCVGATGGVSGELVSTVEFEGSEADGTKVMATDREEAVGSSLTRSTLT